MKQYKFLINNKTYIKSLPETFDEFTKILEKFEYLDEDDDVITVETKGDWKEFLKNPGKIITEITYKKQIPVLISKVQKEGLNLKLLESYKNKDFDKMESCLKEGVDPNLKYNDEYLLIHASVNGNKNAVELLLKYKADINIRDTNGSTSLNCSITKNKFEIANMLIDHDANIKIESKSGNTALGWACYIGNPQLVKRLILKHKKNELKEAINNKGSSGWNILYDACYSGNEEIIKTVLEMGADTNVKNNDGNNIFEFCTHSLDKSFRHLIKYVNIKDLTNYFDSTWDYRQRSDDEFKIIIDRIDVKYKNNHGKTLLMIACDNKMYNNIETLIKKGADVNAKDNDGKTALNYLIDEKTLDLVNLLNTQ